MKEDQITVSLLTVASTANDAVQHSTRRVLSEKCSAILNNMVQLEGKGKFQTITTYIVTPGIIYFLKKQWQLDFSLKLEVE